MGALAPFCIESDWAGFHCSRQSRQRTALGARSSEPRRGHARPPFFSAPLEPGNAPTHPPPLFKLPIHFTASSYRGDFSIRVSVYSHLFSVRGCRSPSIWTSSRRHGVGAPVYPLSSVGRRRVRPASLRGSNTVFHESPFSFLARAYLSAALQRPCFYLRSASLSGPWACDLCAHACRADRTAPFYCTDRPFSSRHGAGEPETPGNSNEV